MEYENLISVQLLMTRILIFEYSVFKIKQLIYMYFMVYIIINNASVPVLLFMMSNKYSRRPLSILLICSKVLINRYLFSFILRI